MKRLTAVLLSLLLVISVGATAFAAFDTSRIDQYFETETQKRIDSMLELVLGKEKAEELVETSRTSSYDFTQVEAYVNQHVAQQSSEMFRLIEAAEQKACDVSPERLYLIPASIIMILIRLSGRNSGICDWKRFYQGDLLLCLYQVWRYKNRSGNL